MNANRSVLAGQSTRRVAATVGWTAGVVLLTPLILLVGLIAVVAAPAVIVTRHIGFRFPARRQQALAPVLHLEPSPAESSVGMISQRAT